ncbi:MAG: cellulase family glycosylhydrolase [Bacteroidales bacterium]|nr:cellulase family glycosylhydrolase [Bacteroidales bacterium]
MKRTITIALALLVALSAFATQAPKKKVKPDYSQIHGVCYGGWRSDDATIRKHLGYAKRIGINSTRIWLPGYEDKAALEDLKRYVRIAHDMGISVMPILFNGNGLNPAILEESYWKEKGDAYAREVVAAIKDEPGLLCWDIMNEPSCNDYHRKAPEEEKPARLEKIFKFVRHYCQLVKEIAPENDITVGVVHADFLEMASPDLVDVISFHDYRPTRERITAGYEIAKGVAEKYGKQLVNSELGCIGRANPYDLALQIANEYNAGWYVFELMINGYWGDVHGIFYDDGTVRDPSIVAAVMGFYRNRDATTMVAEYPNKEGYVDRAIKLAEDAFKEEKEVFKSTKASTDDLLEAAEYCANILESAQMVPMHEPPTAKIQAWRKMDPKDRPEKEIRQFTYNLVKLLKENCEIF